MAIVRSQKLHRSVGSAARWYTMFVAAWLPLSALGGMVLNDPIVWTNSPSLDGWTNTTFISDLDNPGTDGADGAGDGYLRISFTNGIDFIPAIEEDTIFLLQTNTGVDFRDGFGGVNFSFLVSNEAPVSTFLTWHSTNMASTDTWQYAFTPTTTNEWESFTVPFTAASLSDWNQPGGRDFFEDLAYVDWIGINISRLQDAVTSVFGLDNWEYMPVPEPAGLCLIASALLTVLISRRKVAGEGSQGS